MTTEEFLNECGVGLEEIVRLNKKEGDYLTVETATGEVYQYNYGFFKPWGYSDSRGFDEELQLSFVDGDGATLAEAKEDYERALNSPRFDL